MAIDQGLIDRINELANLKKTVGLSNEELEEQAELRQIYLEQFRGNMRSVLDNVDILKEMELSKLVVSKDKLSILIEDPRILKIEDKKINYVITYDVRKIDEKQIFELLKH